MSGYPPPAGFNTNFDSNYPPQGGHGYPPQGQMGYPPQGGPIGYPPQTGGPMGYPPQTGGPMGYPPQAGGPMGAPGQPPFSGPGVPPSAYPQPGYGGPPPTGPPAPGYGSFGYGAQTMGGAMGPGYGGPQPPPPPPAGPGYGAPAGYGGMGAAGPAYGTPPASSGYYSGRPTVVPAPNFDPGKDADELRKAMRGLGTDEDRIIAVLSKRTAAQRNEIVNKYRASFGKDLKKDLKSELSGKFEDVVLASIMDLPTMLATSLYNAMKGAGTKEWVLIQVLVPYSNAIVKATVEAYHKTVGRNLESDIRGDTSGDFEKILVALMQGCREENAPVDMARAQTDADELYAAGEKRLGTEEAVFTRILTQRSFGQIKAISECYRKKYGKSLEKAIKKETSGYYEKTMVSIVRFAEDKNTLLAEWFYESMVGLGTRDEMLIRLVLGRCEIDLQDVKDAYMRKYNKPLVKAIEGDTSGDYRKMLVALVGP